MMHKKFFVTIIIIALLFGLFQAGFIFYKKYYSSSKQIPLETPAGMVRINPSIIPEVFKSIISEGDIRVATESYTYNQQLNSSPTQHTFKYVSNKSTPDTKAYFVNLLTNGKNKPAITEINQSLSLIRGITKDGKH